MRSPLRLEEHAREQFGATFGYPPSAIAVAPGRINIIGEHTDYNRGFVLPAAIDRFVAVAIRLRGDLHVQMVSDRYPGRVELDRLPNQKRGDWTDYVVGVVRQLANEAPPGFDVAVTANLPVGSGLSSSGALEVASAVAFLTSRGATMPPLQLARRCQAAENEFVGAQTGIMDQFTALLARAGHAILLDCRSLAYELVPLPDPGYAWLLADTQVKRELAASAYNQRRVECEAAAAALGLPSLRDASEADVERINDPVQRRRARHVVTENRRVLEAVAALRGGAIRALGPLLYASHASLRDDFSVSCRELDFLVARASELPAVIGARMMGGGFGGCVLALVTADRFDETEKDLGRRYQDEFHCRLGFHHVRSVDGALSADAP